MAKISLTAENLMSVAELQLYLEEITARSTPLENLLTLAQQLWGWEKEYQLPSDLFYARFMRGEMGDNLPFIKWAGRYELYLEAKWELQTQVMPLKVTDHAEKISLAFA